MAGLGTSGTFVGTTRRLKELNPAIRCISLQPDAAFHGLEGWKHMPTAIVPGIYDATLADANLTVNTEDAYRLVKRAAREEGLLLSPSAAAALDGCFQVAASLRRGRARRDRDHLSGFRHKISERAFLGRSLGERSKRELCDAAAADTIWKKKFANMARRIIRTNAAARCWEPTAARAGKFARCFR